MFMTRLGTKVHGFTILFECTKTDDEQTMSGQTSDTDRTTYDVRRQDEDKRPINFPSLTGALALTLMIIVVPRIACVATIRGIRGVGRACAVRTSG